MNLLTAPLFPSWPKLTLLAVIDILVTAFLIYQFLIIIRGRRAANILSGVFVLIAIYLASLYAGLEMLPTLMATLAPYTAFALIVLFQSEIRRMLARMGRRNWMGLGTRLKRREFIEEILLALDQLSRTRTGALIVLERDIGLRTFVESGVLLEAVVSRDLLVSIFHPGNALHDGAVIIIGDRAAAAACFLPLSMNPALMNTLGTRHRAAIGITEETDCLSIVVSEETGKISIASFGEIEGDVSLEKAGFRISAHLGGAERHSISSPPVADAEPAEPPRQKLRTQERP
ncbi:MAG: TIGR00159 family protein [Acidimicrobiia bacterium]|nr:TIGR00159 family protein [Acidimicrobiia bacterium]